MTDASGRWWCRRRPAARHRADPEIGPIPRLARRRPMAYRVVGLVLLLMGGGPLVAQEPSAHPVAAFGLVEASGLRWEHLSSKNGTLPVPGTSTQQTAAVMADLGGDRVNGFVLGFREKAPALVWYRR